MTTAVKLWGHRLEPDPVPSQDLTNPRNSGNIGLRGERTREGKSKARPPGLLRRPGGFLLIWNRPPGRPPVRRQTPSS